MWRRRTVACLLALVYSTALVQGQLPGTGLLSSLTGGLLGGQRAGASPPGAGLLAPITNALNLAGRPPASAVPRGPAFGTPARQQPSGPGRPPRSAQLIPGLPIYIPLGPLLGDNTPEDGPIQGEPSAEQPILDIPFGVRPPGRPQWTLPIGRPPEGRNASRPRPTNCGSLKQECCPACAKDVPLSQCDQWVCNDALQCFQFSDPSGRIPDGGKGFPQACLASPPKRCGEEGSTCCYSFDTTTENGRCQPGLTCVAKGVVSYSSYTLYRALIKNPERTGDPVLLGTCRKLAKADCGQPWMPCGGSARRACGVTTGCSAGYYCASPGDTRLGGARCLPMPRRCGIINRPCCPANAGNVVRERSVFNKSLAVPWCDDAGSMCVWDAAEFNNHGLDIIPVFQGQSLTWDGMSERGYGPSKCIKVDNNCGKLGKPCCPSMNSQSSGMVHNRQFQFQPCDYRSAPKTGVYCAGAWQRELLRPGVQPGNCAANTPDCGQTGKKCCVEDVGEATPVGICMPQSKPGEFYCTNVTSICTKCPTTPTTPDQKANCRVG